jgi:hypothetical protein
LSSVYAVAEKAADMIKEEWEDVDSKMGFGTI